MTLIIKLFYIINISIKSEESEGDAFEIIDHTVASPWERYDVAIFLWKINYLENTKVHINK